MAKPRDLYKSTKAVGDKRPAKPKRRSRPKGDGNNPWALVGAVAALAVGWGLANFGFGRKSSGRKVGERIALSSMLLKPMAFTDHGVCRMDCRHIGQTEVREALQSGTVNNKKSDFSSLPCPKYVVDAKVGQTKKNVQAVFSACPDVTRLITVIDKDRDWECYCP